MEKGNKQRFIPATVFGKSGAGKTSLVESLKENRRILTVRMHSGDQFGEATKVFKVHEAVVDENSKLQMDFGGQEIYQFAYQLTFKTQCLPLLVINMADFSNICDEGNVIEACQDACMSWLSHF